MENYLMTAMSQSQNRAPNTIRLRKEYNLYATDAQSNGESPVPFEQWARSRYPDLKILNQ